MFKKTIAIISLASVASLFSISAVFAEEPQSGAAQAHPADLIISTTSTLENRKIKEYLGVVRGVTVRQPTIGQSLSASLERMKGGHISAYVAMCDKARTQAYDMCLEHARELGANGIVGLQYDSSAFEHGDNVATEVVCYGTAVVLEPINTAEEKDRSVHDKQPVATNIDAEEADEPQR